MNTPSKSSFSDLIAASAKVLNRSGIMISPTDTIPGFCCSATDSIAVNKLLDIKGRSSEKGFIVLANNLQMVKALSPTLRPSDESLFTAGGDRPTTVILPSCKGLDPDVSPPDGSIAIRIISDKFLNSLITELGYPLVSSSVNYSGKQALTDFDLIQAEFGPQVDLIIKDTGSDGAKLPSMIIKLAEDGSVQYIRK